MMVRDTSDDDERGEETSEGSVSCRARTTILGRYGLARTCLKKKRSMTELEGSYVARVAVRGTAIRRGTTLEGWRAAG